MAKAPTLFYTRIKSLIIIYGESGGFFLDKWMEASEPFGYDNAGNLTGDAVFDYEYDAANRLVAVVYPDYYRKEFKYDYQSRRVEEKMIDPSDNTIYRRVTIYDGNRVIAEINPDQSGGAMFLKSYTWGMDIANSLGSASGNIGGLCAIDNWTGGEQYQVGYDGSGNVSLLVNAKTGTLEAEMEYSAFGELVRTTGKWKETPFLYSTKWYLDYGQQSGLLWPLHLYDYGLRVYDPSNGRFLNRDPIGDQGGSNLYAFLGNNPVNNWDYMGLSIMTTWRLDCEYKAVNSMVSLYTLDGELLSYNWTVEWGEECHWEVIEVSELEDLPGTFQDPSGNLEGGNPTQKPPFDGGNQNKKDKWKPNQKDCEALFNAYGDLYFAKAGDQFPSHNQAAIAALFQLARYPGLGKNEAGSGITTETINVGGFLGFGGSEETRYSFTGATQGSTNSWDIASHPGIRSHNREGTLAGWNHRHPDDGAADDFSYWIANNTGHGVLMAGDMTFENYGRRANLLDGNLRMLYAYPSQYPNTFSNIGTARAYDNAVNESGIGKKIPGSPSSQTTEKLLSCEKAGFGK